MLSNALFNPETSMFIQKRHPSTGTVNSGTPGDSKNVILHRDVKLPAKNNIATVVLYSLALKLLVDVPQVGRVQPPCIVIAPCVVIVGKVVMHKAYKCMTCMTSALS